MGWGGKVGDTRTYILCIVNIMCKGQRQEEASSHFSRNYSPFNF